MNSTGADACATCPGGYYCDGVYTKTYFECPQGSFCPAGTGTSRPTCPKGTYGASAGLKSSGECTTCPSGHYCGSRGLTQTSGPCSEGFYCPAGSQNDKGGNGTIAQRICPVGAFCVGGVGSPELCPAGTFNPQTGITSRSDCTLCTDGSYCATPGLAAVTGPCDAGYFCRRGVESATPSTGKYLQGGMWRGGDICVSGEYCPEETVVPNLCAAGTYNDVNGTSVCSPCPSGFYCPTNTANAAYEELVLACPAGYYCPESTEYASQYPCPAVSCPRHGARTSPSMPRLTHSLARVRAPCRGDMVIVP